MGFYCVDNLPVELIPIFAELHAAGEGRFRARGLARGRARRCATRETAGLARNIFGANIPSRSCSSKPAKTPCCAATAKRGVRIPLASIFRVRESLVHERRLMEPIRKLADVVIDTSKFNVHELRHFITERFKNPEKRSDARFPGQFRLSLRRAHRCRSRLRRALPAESAFRSPAAAVSPARIPKSAATSARFRRPANFCAASRACSST